MQTPLVSISERRLGIRYIIGLLGDYGKLFPNGEGIEIAEEDPRLRAIQPLVLADMIPVSILPEFQFEMYSFGPRVRLGKLLELGFQTPNIPLGPDSCCALYDWRDQLPEKFRKDQHGYDRRFIFAGAKIRVKAGELVRDHYLSLDWHSEPSEWRMWLYPPEYTFQGGATLLMYPSVDQNADLWDNVAKAIKLHKPNKRKAA